MTAPAFLNVQKGLVLLRIKVQPRASRNAIGGILGDELKVSVTAPPVDSAANEMVIHYLAELLERPRRALQIRHGHNSRHKVIAIEGTSAEQVLQRLSIISD